MVVISNKLVHLYFVLVLIILLCFDGRVSGGNSVCNGSIAECDENVENLMNSEINRRLLAQTKKYIGYPVVNTDNAPCHAPGQPYDCLGLQANKNTRVCPKRDRCSRYRSTS